MGQVATIYKFEESELARFKKEGKLIREHCKGDLYVGGYWEPIMFIFGKGSLGRIPTRDLFMPTNSVYLGESEEFWADQLRWHTKQNIEQLNEAMKAFTEDRIRKELDLEWMNESMNNKVYPNQIDELVAFALKVKEFFEAAEKDDYIIVVSIG